MLIQRERCARLLRLTTIFLAVPLFTSRAEVITMSELIQRLKGVDGGSEQSFFADIAFTEIESIVGRRSVEAPQETLTGYYIPDRYITKFFFNHTFYWFIMSWKENPEQFYFIAVNKESLTPFLLLGDPEGGGSTEKKHLNVSSNTLFSRELNLENLNTVIRSENISINGHNLKAYVQEIFGILGIDCYGGLYVNWDNVINSRISGIEQDKSDSTARMYDIILRKGNEMYVSPLDGGAFHVVILTWINGSGEVSEWDFTINSNGTVTLHDIRDISAGIGKLKSD